MILLKHTHLRPLSHTCDTLIRGLVRSATWNTDCTSWSVLLLVCASRFYTHVSLIWQCLAVAYYEVGPSSAAQRVQNRVSWRRFGRQNVPAATAV